jgi:hypothetical protein
MMSFQVVELELDARGNVLERRIVPYPYQSRHEAMAAVESIAAEYGGASFDEVHNYWDAVGGGGECLRLAVEEIGSRPRE